MGLDLFPAGLGSDRLLAVDDAGARLYGRDLDAACAALSRAMGGRALVFLLCRNEPGTLLGYLLALRGRPPSFEQPYLPRPAPRAGGNLSSQLLLRSPGPPGGDPRRPA